MSNWSNSNFKRTMPSLVRIEQIVSMPLLFSGQFVIIVLSWHIEISKVGISFFFSSAMLQLLQKQIANNKQAQFSLQKTVVIS